MIARRPDRRGLRGRRGPARTAAASYLAPGIIDIGVKVGEPGERHKESFRTAGAAAAAGGVTTIVTRPDTRPAIDTPEALEFLQRRAVGASPVNVLPMAALTKGREGREMTEIGFLMDAGAVAFTDAARGGERPRVPALPDLCRRARRAGRRPPAGAGALARAPA